MAVISCTKSREGRSGSYEISSKRNWSAKWQVLTNDDNDGPQVVLANGPFVGPHPVPVIGALYGVGNDVDAISYCTNLKADVRAGRVREYTVTAEFRPLEPGQEYNDIVSTNPLTRPVHYKLEHESWTRIVEKDKDGIALKNSAGVPFETGVELPDSYLVLTAEKNYATLDAIIALNFSFMWKVNNGIYRGGAARTWLCQPILSSDIQTENNITFYRASFRLVYNPETWDAQILDKGYSELNGGLLRDILDKNKQPITEPWPLNGSGAKLPEGQNLVFLSKRLRGEVAFSGLGV